MVGLWLWFWLIVVIIVFGGWGWYGWYGGWGGPWGRWPARQAGATGQITSQPGTALQRQVPETTREFLGRTLTVSGKIDKVFSTQAFTLAGPRGGRDLLVIDKNGNANTVKQGETVQVTGTVEGYNATDLLRHTGVDLSKVPSSEFVGRPAVVASAVSAGSGHGS